MARQILAKQQGSPSGKAIVWTTPTADGLMWQPEDGDLLLVKNGNAGTLNITFPIPRVVGGVALSPRVESLTTGTEQAFAFERGTYNRPSGGADEGYMYADFSVQSSVQVSLWSPAIY